MWSKPGGSDWSLYTFIHDIKRTDHDLVPIIEQIGERANDDCSELTVEEIPKGSMYRIRNYDGLESIELKESDDWCIA